MATLNAASLSVAVDMRLFFPWVSITSIGTINPPGPSTQAVVTSGTLAVTYNGTGLTASGNNPESGSYTSIGVAVNAVAIGTLTGFTAASFGGIDLAGFAFAPLAGNDIINGSNADGDYLFAGPGADTFNGNGGKDFFEVAGTDAEFDTFNGGTGDDSLVIVGDTPLVLNTFNAAASSVEFILGNETRVYGNAGANVLDFRGLVATEKVLTIKGAGGADTIFGPNGGASLAGEEGDDFLTGGSGNDTIFGGAGRDTLTGGVGEDLFTFMVATDSPKKKTGDLITDFKVGEDTLSFTFFDADPSTPDKINKFRFAKKEGADFKGKVGQLVFDEKDKPGKANDVTFVKGDLDGNNKPDFVITLKGLIDLQKTDFELRPFTELLI